MRVEIDLPNPDGALRDGMYGQATIRLQTASQSLALPVECVQERTGKGKASIRLVRDGVIHRTDVELGADNGSLVEVVSGLRPDDRVVLRSSTVLEEGMQVLGEDRG
jgi:multidrug efflux pump subunit AcrA (membrane-fusion protein)